MVELLVLENIGLPSIAMDFTSARSSLQQGAVRYVGMDQRHKHERMFLFWSDYISTQSWNIGSCRQRNPQKARCFCAQRSSPWAQSHSFVLWTSLDMHSILESKRRLARFVLLLSSDFWCRLIWFLNGPIETQEDFYKHIRQTDMASSVRTHTY